SSPSSSGPRSTGSEPAAHYSPGRHHTRPRRLPAAAGPESVEDGGEAGFEVLGGVALAEFGGSLDDLGRGLITDRDGDEPFAGIGGAGDFPEHRSEREHQQGV